MAALVQRINAELYSRLQIHGLQLRADAHKYLVEVLKGQDNFEEALEIVVEALTKEDLPEGLVDRATVERIIGHLTDDSASHVDPVQVIQAFDVPRYRYQLDRKAFTLVPGKPSLLATASVKADMFRDRYLLLFQRLMRSRVFAPPSMSGFSVRQDAFSLTPVNNLIAVSGTRLVLGMLSQLEEGQYFLEDLDGTVRLDLRAALLYAPTIGLFTEGCFVICEGEMRSGTFVVSALCFPILEARTVSLSNMGPLRDVDLFGGRRLDAHEQALIAQIEQTDAGGMMVILSDVWLDEPKVLEHLRALFSGYTEAGIVPILFAFLGNFFRSPYTEGIQNLTHMQRCFDALADVVSEFAALAQGSHFLFVPGPSDPGPGTVLPRPPLPPALQTSLRRVCQRVSFGTNPCRVRYCRHDIMFFREDLVSKMRRHCILPLRDTETELSAHLVQTVFEQSHLCPLPLRARPTYWAYDHALRLYPLPHLTVLADKYDQYRHEQEGAQAVNPGSFPLDTSFVSYTPSTGDVQFCRVVPLPDPDSNLDALLGLRGEEDGDDERETRAGASGNESETAAPASAVESGGEGAVGRRKGRKPQRSTEGSKSKPQQTSLRALFGLPDQPVFPAANALEIEAASAALPATQPDSIAAGTAAASIGGGDAAGSETAAAAAASASAGSKHSSLGTADESTAAAAAAVDSMETDTGAGVGASPAGILAPSSAALPATFVFQPRSPQPTPPQSPRSLRSGRSDGFDDDVEVFGLGAMRIGGASALPSAAAGAAAAAASVASAPVAVASDDAGSSAAASDSERVSRALSAFVLRPSPVPSDAEESEAEAERARVLATESGPTVLLAAEDEDEPDATAAAADADGAAAVAATAVNDLGDAGEQAVAVEDEDDEGEEEGEEEEEGPYEDEMPADAADDGEPSDRDRRRELKSAQRGRVQGAAEAADAASPDSMDI